MASDGADFGFGARAREIADNASDEAVDNKNPVMEKPAGPVKDESAAPAAIDKILPN